MPEIGSGRSVSLGERAATASQPESLPGSVQAFAYLHIGLGVVAAFAGVAGIFSGDTSLLLNGRLLFVVLGGVLVVAYGVVILTRSRLALGRWWFLAAWFMGLLTPLGLLSLALIVWSTLVLRRKHATLFSEATVP